MPIRFEQHFLFSISLWVEEVCFGECLCVCVDGLAATIFLSLWGIFEISILLWAAHSIWILL